MNQTTPSLPKNKRAESGYIRFGMSIQLVLVDVICLLLAAGIAIGLWSLVNPTLEPSYYLRLLPLLPLFILLYTSSGLYPAIGISPVEELRRLSLATTFMFLGLAAISFYVRNAEAFSRAAFGLAWILSLLLIPVGREVYRSLASRTPIWGEPVALYGFGERGRGLFVFLQKNPQIGLKPRVIIGDPGDSTHLPEGVTFLTTAEILAGSANGTLADVHTAILVKDEIAPDIITRTIEEPLTHFAHLILLSDLLPIGSIWVTPYDMGGVLGLEIRQNLLSKRQQFAKRLLDLGITFALLPVLIPMLALITLLVLLDSSGNPFFTHPRIGHNGRTIKVLKFRTMVQNAQQVLQEYLSANPEAQQEWNNSRKLKHDPRITRIGWFLRKFSLDELPQVWNVLKGEMSLVGPRPIVTEEIPYYGTYFNLYKQVKVGITGMWQISGRNDVGYSDRVQLDSYYVRNWSVWLDIYILMHTAATVLSGKGAY